MGDNHSLSHTKWECKKALELVFTGDILDALEAERIGLVSRVVPPGRIDTPGARAGQKNRRQPPISVELAKKVMWEKVRNQLREALFFESYAQGVGRTTQDQKEAVKAFMEKREPVFKGL